MTPEMVMDLAYRGMRVSLFVAAPLLLTTLAVGLIVSLFQAATQINESTLSFIPKIIGICAVLVLAGPLMMDMILDFTRDLLVGLPGLVG
ncbi:MULTISPECIES: flagellar biosynthesis protein FliQ [Pseudomonas]|uniref:Flagellar biosynthetic protein FliQ n=2 Tax=Pseudomonas eucalypticola TaxID=2599595 RepID=A0A7D5DBA2_9PSED|nr:MULTISPECIES: flagellar biosynthesis protein FliQ [Pseudomonas]QKZ07317.1 flagellar biosynthesis protein FliQ [Pseudomonas eucalypticola]